MMYHESKSETSSNNMSFDLTTGVPHCPVVLVLDTSHSMWGQGLTDLQHALMAFCKSIAGDEFSGSQIDIAAVSMGSNLGMLEEFTSFRDSHLPLLSIRPKGDTPIGGALTLALQTIDRQLSQYQAHGCTYVTPQLIILSDGESSDDFSTAASEIRRRSHAGAIVCRAIAMGNTPKLDALAEIAGNNVLQPRYGNLRETFADVAQNVSQIYEKEAADMMEEEAAIHPPETSLTYLLDGSNMLYWDQYRSGITLAPVLAVTDYLDREGIAYQVYFDATAPHLLRKNAPEDALRYENLLKQRPNQFRQVPGGTRADDFLLALADQDTNMILISNDRYRDHEANYPWLRQNSRVFPGMILNDTIFFPKLSLKVPWNPPEKTSGSGL